MPQQALLIFRCTLPLGLSAHPLVHSIFLHSDQSIQTQERLWAVCHSLIIYWPRRLNGTGSCFLSAILQLCGVSNLGQRPHLFCVAVKKTTPAIFRHFYVQQAQLYSDPSLSASTTLVNNAMQKRSICQRQLIHRYIKTLVPYRACE